MDKWVLSKLHSLVKTVTEELDAYHVTEAARAINAFVDELSNWYVRRGRDRYWGGERTADKSAAFFTLYTVLETLTRLCAPFVPFMTESIYQNLVRSVNPSAPESVHLCDFPSVDESWIDPALEAEMDAARDIVVLGRAARNASKVKNRQPLARMLVQGETVQSEAVQSIILDELNVKAMEAIDDASGYIAYAVKPQLKTLGPKYGKILPAIRTYLQQADGTAIVAAVENGGTFTAEIGGQSVSLTEEDLLVETVQKEGFAAQSDHGVCVVLDVRLTPELIEEGLVREVISKIQTMRKEADFQVTDRIEVGYEAEQALAKAIADNAEMIQTDVLATRVEAGANGGFCKEWNINGLTATLYVQRVNA